MNLRKNNLLTLLLLLCCTAGKAQMRSFSYKRPLGNVTAGWHKIVLPNAVFGKLAAGFSDIRILGLASGGDTLEAPYVLRSSAGDPHSKKVVFEMLNTVQNAKGYYYTFELPAGEPVNEIGLQVANNNFDWRVQLEGSQNQEEWFTILSDYRILAIQNAQTDFRFTTLRFPDARYRYLRLLVKSTESPQHLTAAICRTDSAAGRLQSYGAMSQKSIEDKATKQTQIELSLSEPVPVSRVQIAVADSFDYYRPATVEYLQDSFQTPAGWRYNWGVLYSGTLNSIDRSAFSFEPVVARRLRIIMENGDNRPLHTGGVKVAGPVYSLIARFDEPAAYFLVYGNAGAAAPDYDIARFGDKIPASPPVVVAADEERIAHTTVPPAEPLFKNKVWLWAAIVVIGLLLGVATLRMVRKTG